MTTVTVHDKLDIAIKSENKVVAMANNILLLEAAAFLQRPLQKDERWIITGMINGTNVELTYQQAITILINHHAVTGVSDPERFAMIAICMTDSVLPALANLDDKGRFSYPGLIAMVAGWALEFHQLYPTIIERWDQFQTTSMNVYHSSAWEEFVLAWGNEKLAQTARRYGLAT